MTSNFWKGLFENLGTRLNFSSAYHPQTDGQSEIANLTVLDLLKAYVTEVDQRSQWEKYLPLVEYAYNNTVHTFIGKAPFEVIEGRSKSPLLLKVHGKIFAADEYSRDLKESFQKIKEAISIAQQKQKAAANKHRRALAFKENDWVLLKFPKARLRQTTGKNPTGHQKYYAKLAKRYYGPFQILKPINEMAYQLKLPNHWLIHNAFHVSLLKPYKGEPPREAIIEDPPEVEGQEEVLQPESVLRHEDKLELELAQPKANLELQKQQIEALSKGKEAVGSLTSTSQIHQAETHLHIQQPLLPERPEFQGPQEEKQPRPTLGALDIKEQIEQEVEDMPEGPAKKYLLYEKKVMESTALALLQPDEQIMDFGHDFLPLPLMHHEVILWKEKMRPAVPQNEEGVYEGIPLTSEEAQTLIEDHPRWRKKWLSERPRDLTKFHNTPQSLQIDPTYYPVPRRRSWVKFQKWKGKNKALLNYPVLLAQEPPTVTYVVNTLNQTIQLLRDVPDLTCQMLVKIARMIVTYIQAFRDTEDDDHPWNLFLEGRRGICWNLRDSR
ncbi:hypothetical protein L7F22_009425 [Adiantum nelumboides]|nr:hypothetical protein [Adiantum nelumboides]